MTAIGKDFPVRVHAFLLSSERRASSAAISPADTLCLDIFSPRPGDSDVASQVDRLSSNETNIAQRSVPIVVGAADGSATSCMVASRVGGKRPHAAKSPGATTTSWDLEKDDVHADPTTLSGKADTAG